MSNKPSQLPPNAHPALAGFRRENLLCCFDALCTKDTLTRAELATATGLSIMTTGKIADALVECGVLGEQKLPGAGAGRRPGTLQFDAKPTFLILSLYSRRFAAHVISPDMQARQVAVYDYNDVFPYDDNLLIFLNALRRSCNTSPEAIPHLGLIVSPEQDARQSITRALEVSPRSREHLVEFVCRMLHRACDLVIDEITAAQTYIGTRSACRDVGCGVFISLSDMTYAAVWMKGNLLCPRVCRIGELLLPEHRRVADALADALCTSDAVLPTAYAISTLESFFTPDYVLLESGRFRLDQAFLDDVYDALAPMLPVGARIIPLHLSDANPLSAVCGCAAELRRAWFYELSGLQIPPTGI